MTIKKFSLDAVLNYRKQQEDIARQKFVQAQLDEQKKEEELQALLNEQASLFKTLNGKQETGILASELARYEERINYLRNQILLTKSEVAKKKDAVRQKRAFLLKKSKEYKVLETLKENQDREWQEYQNKKEASMLDEIAVLRHERGTTNHN